MTHKHKKPTQVLTPEEETQILQAAARTWSYIASDAASMGATSIRDAIELVIDADRIVSLGGLGPKLYHIFTALPVSTQDAFMIKNRSRWF